MAGLSVMEKAKTVADSDVKRDPNILYEGITIKDISNRHGLFPNEFHRSYFYPSLDVADLDTVDFGVYEKLPFEVKNKTDWSLVIGHMLGVDHCGHTFGSLTPHIGKKLLEIDSFIDDVINIVDEDTLVMTFGDHGMTLDGNHGGGSLLEMRSALFAYQKTPFPMYEVYNKKRLLKSFEDMDKTIK